VPFDFDGQRFLWMKYLDRDVREIYIYHFYKSEHIELVKRFEKGDGMISHVHFLKLPGGGGNYIFYVKDTQFIVRLNLETKESEVIGKTNDVVIAFQVSYNIIRTKCRQLPGVQA
jgi:hypothetical protein